MGLAALLIPLIPSLIQSVTQIINTIRVHPDTPAAAHADLDALSTHLQEAVTKVLAIKI